MRLLYQDLTQAIIGAAMEVHRELGPGFLESVYREALGVELQIRGIAYEQEFPLQVMYKGKCLGEFKPDMLVDGKVILELKAVREISQTHIAQALHYLTSTGIRLALVLNFGAGSLQWKRVIR